MRDMSEKQASRRSNYILCIYLSTPSMRCLSLATLAFQGRSNIWQRNMDSLCIPNIFGYSRYTEKGSMNSRTIEIIRMHRCRIPVTLEWSSILIAIANHLLVFHHRRITTFAWGFEQSINRFYEYLRFTPCTISDNFHVLWWWLLPFNHDDGDDNRRHHKIPVLYLYPMHKFNCRTNLAGNKFIFFFFFNKLNQSMMVRNACHAPPSLYIYIYLYLIE